jgi:hypothetical protein
MLILALCICLLPLNIKANAQTLQAAADEVVIGIVATGAVLVVGAILVIHHYHSASIQGCAISGPNGIALRNENDQQLYELAGETAGVKSGDRVRVTGKKQKAASGDPVFLVQKLSKNYGACEVAASK